MKLDFRHTKPYNDYQRHQLRMRRLMTLRGLVVAGFVLQWAVFWYLQVVRGPYFRELAEENRLHQRIERALRGQVTDEHGEVLVTNRPTFAVFLAPERTKSAEAEVRALARILQEDDAPLLALLQRARRAQGRYQPVQLLADVDLETASRIEAHRLELPAIDVEMTAKRAYVLGAQAAHVLGYVSEASEPELNARKELLMGDRVGRTGAERAYDGELRGVAGIALWEVNASGRPLAAVGSQRPPRNGRALRLTMDAAVQRDLVEAFGDNMGAGVFIDPYTGGVKALYSAPSFDPNVFGGRLSPAVWRALIEDKARPLHNRAVSSAYNPGSTFKVFMAAAALEAGATSEGDRLFCGGSGNFYGRQFMCWKKGGHGTIGVQDAITRSCNVFFYNMGKRLGAQKMHDWAVKFGLGQPSGLKFDHEALGLVPDDEWSRKRRKQPIYPGEVISMAIGQGLVQVSPIQNAVLAAAIANGGFRVYPHLVDRPGDAPEPTRVGLSPATLRIIAAGMNNVVDSDSGTARRARVPGWHMAGKTGTAQTIGRDAGITKKDNAWFMGFGPVERPRMAWGIIVEAGGHGGDSAAPISGLVMKRYMERLAARQAPAGGPVLYARREIAPPAAAAGAAGAGPAAAEDAPGEDQEPVIEGPAEGVPAHDAPTPVPPPPAEPGTAPPPAMPPPALPDPSQPPPPQPLQEGRAPQPREGRAD